MTSPMCVGRGIAHRVGNVYRRRAGVDRGLDHLAEEVVLGASGVLGRELHVADSSPRPALTPATAWRMISSLSILSLNSRWIALVARKTWIRGGSACLTASQARSMSSSRQRASPQMTGTADGSGDLADGLEVAGRSDGEARLDDVDSQVDQRLGDLHFLGEVHAGAGRLLAVAQRRVENYDTPVGRWIHGRCFLWDSG